MWKEAPKSRSLKELVVLAGAEAAVGSITMELTWQTTGEADEEGSGI